MHTSTAKLCSEQGKTDLSELMVINEMIQTRQCKWKVPLHTWSNSERRIAEKSVMLKETTANMMIRSNGLQWRVGTIGLTRHLSQARQEGTKIIISKVEQRDGKTDADYRNRTQEDSRTYETKASWDNIASRLRETHNMTLQQSSGISSYSWRILYETTASTS